MTKELLLQRLYTIFENFDTQTEAVYAQDDDLYPVGYKITLINRENNIEYKSYKASTIDEAVNKMMGIK